MLTHISFVFCDQKTAYERRISDWSSDVCSSDLRRSHDDGELLAALQQRMTDAGAFFENEPVVIDASLIAEIIDWSALLQALRGHSLHPVGVVAQGANLEAALAQGLAAVDLGSPTPRPTSQPAPEQEVPVVAPPPTTQGSNAKASAAEQPPPSATGVPEVAPAAMVINRPLRSGQRIYARNTDLIVIGVVSQGAEVIADGNIHVYGPLRGKAMAGARGDTSARIFTTQLDPELLAIAGVYRVRSEEHTSELQSLMRSSYAVFC